jgi:alkylhydroperoxidase family enzyme
MARLPLIDLAGIPGPFGETLRARPPLNIYRVLPNAPEVGAGFLALGRAILGQSAIDPQLRELAILRVGALSRAHYEVHQHKKVARMVGVPEAKIEAVLVSADDPVFSDTERAVLQFTDAVVRDVKAPDPLYAQLAAQLSPQWQLELMMTIGFYMLVSRLLENFEVELEAQNVEMTEMPRD